MTPEAQWHGTPDACGGDDSGAGVESVPGRVQLLDIGGNTPLSYYLWRHPDGDATDRWLVAVHGISRDAREQVRLLRAAAAIYGFSLVCPLFDEARYRGYQQLGLGGAGLRADRALMVLHDALGRRFVMPSRFDLFGFSGGAQFAHRFALMHPHRVRRLGIAAAGWYTLLDGERAFPYGTRTDSIASAPRAALAEFVRIPQLVLVGSEDTRRDGALRKREHLDREQGRNRRLRASAWVASVRRVGLALGHAPSIDECVLEGVGHDFSEAVHRGRLPEHLFDFLIEQG
jgi:pimeloyl-ACP methyl ester carboxylesterase